MELFENTHSGSVCCAKHLGMEASTKFASKPNAKSVKTSFGTIRKMDQANIAGWMEMVGDLYASGCEICK